MFVGGMTSFVVKTRTGRKIRINAPWSRITHEASNNATARGGSSRCADGSRGSSSAPVFVVAKALTSACSVRSAGRRCGHGALRCGRHRPVDAVVPLLGQGREGPVRVHVVDDLAHGLTQALRVTRVV